MYILCRAIPSYYAFMLLFDCDYDTSNITRIRRCVSSTQRRFQLKFTQQIEIRGTAW